LGRVSDGHNSRFAKTRSGQNRKERKKGIESEGKKSVVVFRTDPKGFPGSGLLWLDAIGVVDTHTIFPCIAPRRHCQTKLQISFIITPLSPTRIAFVPSLSWRKCLYFKQKENHPKRRFRTVPGTRAAETLA
jgi:hypothetical protein